MKNKIFRTIILPLLRRGLGGGVLLLTATFPAFADETPDLLVCNSKGYILKPAVAAAGAGLAYKWYEKTGSDGAYGVVGGTDASLTVAAGKAAGTYSYVRTVTGTGCTDEVASNTYTVVVLATPDAPTISVSDICQNTGDLVFSIDPVAGTTYTWTLVSGTAGVASGDDHSTYTVSGAAAGTTVVQASASLTYNISSFPAKVCTSALTAEKTAKVNPLPEVTQTGTTAWCGSASHELEVNATVGGSSTGVTVAWYDNAGGSGTPLSITTTYTVPAATSGSDVKEYKFHVKATVGATGCVNSPLEEITATRNLFEGAIVGQEN